MKRSGGLCKAVVFVWLFAGISPAGSEPAGERALVAPPGLGLRFSLPTGFLLGKFRQEQVPDEIVKLGLDSWFNDAVVLVEPDVAKGLKLDALPVGDVPTISLHRRRDEEDVKFQRQFFQKEQFRRRIGAWEVYALPAFPGPYGDQGHYYVVLLADGSILAVVAHKSYFGQGPELRRREGKPTHYDRVVETLIRSLEMIE